VTPDNTGTYLPRVGGNGYGEWHRSDLMNDHDAKGRFNYALYNSTGAGEQDALISSGDGYGCGGPR